MKQFIITGMSCAACQARVEKAASKVKGVESCAVSLLTNTMGVAGDFNDSDIIKAVTEAGYGARLKGEAGSAAPAGEDILTDTETPVLKKRLFSGLAVLLVLMYFSMGHMFSLPLPAFFDGNPAALGLLQLILCSVVMLINKKFFISGFKSLLHGSPNMDTLVALGSSASFLWSVFILFTLTDAGAAAKWGGHLYFDSAAMILTLITLGKTLEAKSKGRTTDALKALIRLAPDTVTIEKDGKELTVPAKEAQKGDIFIVRPGESIPVDGIIIEGSTSVNEAALTGESIPVDKNAGDTVSAATINQEGFIRCRAERVRDDTALAKIISLVSDAQATKAPIAKLADKVSGIFVPAVAGIALLTLIVWLLTGNPFETALKHAISVLVISCPCALGLATPVAIMVGSGLGARHGILFKTAESLEKTGKIKICVLDKTGTVTNGEPEIVNIFTAEGISEDYLLRAACSLEAPGSHPLAKAVGRLAEYRGYKPEPVKNFIQLPGNGLKAEWNGKEITGGSLSYTESIACIPAELKEKCGSESSSGATPLIFTENGAVLGALFAADTVRPDSKAAVSELKDMGIRVVMLTGDNLNTAKHIGREAGIDNIIGNVLPEDKEAVIERLSVLGPCAMTGDGINDAPALTKAYSGIAIGAGADVAIDAADVVLVNSSLRDAAAAIRLSRRTLLNIKENLFWAFFYNVLCIPLAAGCYVNLLGWELSPALGALAMSFSSFFVVSNALRLNLFDIYNTKKERRLKDTVDEEKLSGIVNEINEIIKTSKEEKKMTKTIKIDGMMCPHCEAHTVKALEALPGVEEAKASHVDGEAIVTLSQEVSDELLKKAVEDAGYTVTGII